MISATYFDGKTPRLHAVELDLNAGHIGIAGADIACAYAYADARMAEPFAHAPAIIDFADGGRCELADPAAKSQLAQALGFRKSTVMRWQQHWYGALLALILLLLSIVVFVQYGVPALAERVVASLPDSVDKRVGDQALQSLDERMFQQSRLSTERVAEIQAILREVMPRSTRMPITLRVVDIEGMPPNALALPNGSIFITDAMIRQIMGKESEISPPMRAAIAGVLAHEIGHVQGRHSMRAIVRTSMMALASATLFGDFSAVVAGAPVMLLNMDYSRRMEVEADMFAIDRLVAAGMSPAHLADLFDGLDKLAPGMGEMPKWMKKHIGYLSSHPASEDRSERFRTAAAEQEALRAKKAAE